MTPVEGLPEETVRAIRPFITRYETNTWVRRIGFWLITSGRWVIVIGRALLVTWLLILARHV